MNTYQYKAACKALHFIESSTRYKPDEVTITRQECMETEFAVEVFYKLSAETKFTKLSTKFTTRLPNDIWCDFANSSQIIENITYEIYTNEQLLAACIKEIKSTKFSKLKEINFGTYHKRVLFEEICFECNGYGETERFIGGTPDSYEYTSWYTDGNGHEHGGEELVEGIPDETILESCSSCDGFGKTITVFSFQVAGVPDRYNLSKNGLNVDVMHALENREELKSAHQYGDELSNISDISGYEVSTKYKFRTHIFYASCSVRGKAGRIVILGNNFTVSTSDALLESLVSDDLNALKLSAANQSFQWAVITQASKSIKLFMQSEINKLAIEKANVKEIDFKELSKSTSGAVSANYLKLALGALEKTCKKIKDFYTYAALITAILICAYVIAANIQSSFFEGLFKSALIFIVAGWVRHFSFNAHLFLIGGNCLLRFIKMRTNKSLRWYGW